MRLIDANSILDEFLKRYTEMESDGKLVFSACEIKQDFADMISNAPTVDAVVRHGRWISYLDGDLIRPDRYYRCSECCDRGWGRKWPYCPNCGAKMDGDGNG